MNVLRDLAFFVARKTGPFFYENAIPKQVGNRRRARRFCVSLRHQMTKEIVLTNGMSVLVDDDIYPELMRHNWYVHRNGSGKAYAGGRVNGKYVLIHRFIMSAPNGKDVDHINGNGLDCRRSNMRVCTRSENLGNRQANRNSKQPYRGIWRRANGKWQATINIGGKYTGIGLYETAEEAASARDKMGIKIYGKFYKSSLEHK